MQKVQKQIVRIKSLHAGHNMKLREKRGKQMSKQALTGHSKGFRAKAFLQNREKASFTSP